MFYLKYSILVYIDSSNNLVMLNYLNLINPCQTTQANQE